MFTLFSSYGIHGFREADRQKSPSEELIVSWPVHRLTFLKRFRVVVFRVFPNHEVQYNIGVGIKRKALPMNLNFSQRGCCQEIKILCSFSFGLLFSLIKLFIIVNSLNQGITVDHVVKLVG